MYCKLFATILQDSAQQWFIELSPKRITNYTCNKLMRKKSHHLLSIIQEKDETIKTYMRRFKTEKMEINRCLDFIAIEAFRKGIKRDTRLFIELKKIPNALYMLFIKKLKNL